MRFLRRFMGIFAFILVGLVVGLSARALTAGKLRLVPTALFALAGSFVGALIGTLFYGRRIFELHSAPLIATALIAFTLLFLLGVRARGRRGATF